MDLQFLKVEANISMQRFKRKQSEMNSDQLVRITFSSKDNYTNIPTKIRYSFKSSIKQISNSAHY